MYNYFYSSAKKGFFINKKAAIKKGKLLKQFPFHLYLADA